MKKLSAVLFLVILIFILAACAAPGQKIGVIDVTKVLEESQRAREYQNQLDARKSEVQKRLESEMGNLKEEERVAEFQKAYQELDRLGRELGQQLHLEIEQAVQKVAEEEQLDIVINNKAVLYGGEDITDEVIEELGGPVADEDTGEGTAEQDAGKEGAGGQAEEGEE